MAGDTVIYAVVHQPSETVLVTTSSHGGALQSEEFLSPAAARVLADQLMEAASALTQNNHRTGGPTEGGAR